MKEPVIYWIKNTENGKLYVGSTTNRYVRWRTHRKKLRSGTHHCKHLQAAWLKYGEAVFVFEVVEKVLEESELQAAEDRWLVKFYGRPECYNIGKRSGAPWRGVEKELHPNYGRVVSDAQKATLRVSALRQWAEADPRTGKKHSTESKAKIIQKVQAALQKGRGGRFIPSEETRAKMSASLKGNQNSKGRVWTEEHRKKMSEAVMGNKNFLGKRHSEEAKAKMGCPIVSVSPDGVEHYYTTITNLRAALGISAPTVYKVLESGVALADGKHRGWLFRRA